MSRGGVKTNAIYCGDCTDVLAAFPEETVDLIYVDPPFFSNKHYEVIWNDGAEIRAFEDRWKGGIENYVAWMEPKLRECHRVLKLTGSMYLHCDPHANAHLRILMDRIFEENNFRNEIVWQRTHAHGGGETGFSRVHDNILFYVKSAEFKFNRQHVPYSKSYVENFFKLKEQDGRPYQLVIATGSGETKNDYRWKGRLPTKGRHWAYKLETMEDLERQGRLVYPKSGSGIPRIKQYLKEKDGTLVTDIWSDVGVIQSQSKERLGYPTQKPLALLERIIKASSNEGDMVLDPMCGCGTAIAASHNLKRKWIGIDISPTACKLMVRRMRELHVDISEKDIIGLPKTFEDIKAMQPFEFQNWVCQKIMAVVSSKPTGDMGIDGWIGIEKIPLQVKQSDGIGRNVVDNFETALRRVKKSKGVIVAFSFGKGAYEEAARAKNEDKLEITLMTAKELVEGD